MKRVVSISLGSSTRNKMVQATFLGETFQVERVGTDGDLELAIQKIAALDGQVDAIGLGGIDLYLIAGRRKYVIRDAQRLAAAAQTTPVVDGSGLKNTLERETVFWLAREGRLGPGRWTQEENRWRWQGPPRAKPKVLLVSAVDRFGMAEAFVELRCPVVFGDLIFALGIPCKLRSLGTVRMLAALLLPILCRQPFEKLYPTGEKQEKITPKHARLYAWADVIAGDFHLIRRYLPPPVTISTTLALPAKGPGPFPLAMAAQPLAGKTILTNTVTVEDMEELRIRGLHQLITTTPEFDGRSFGTNVMEGVLLTLAGKRPEDMTPEDYLGLLKEVGWQPRVVTLNEA